MISFENGGFLLIHDIAALLTEVVKRNPTNFRIFSPDELGSNKLDAVFDVT